MFTQSAARILTQLNNQELAESSFGDEFPSVNAVCKVGPLTRDDMQKLVIALGRDVEAVALTEDVNWKTMGYYEREAWVARRRLVSQLSPIYRGILELIEKFQLTEPI